jgi:serine/threonine protein kinase
MAGSLAKLVAAASDLVGQTIGDGWLVTEQLPRPGQPGAEDLTGSFFSIGYIAEKGGQRAFVKVIDLYEALCKRDDGLSQLQRLKLLTDEHSFECTVLEVCRGAKLNRIVRVIDQGVITSADEHLPIDIPYIIFELADGDVRKAIKRANKIEDAWRFQVLHDVAAGIQQLHRNSIAHQDIKPSNVLVFGKRRAKIGDFGRASLRGTGSNHDKLPMPGAPRYAPPEQVFGVRPERWEDRREGCDIYHLGSLAAFLFAGITPSVHYVRELGPDMRPTHWGGNASCDYETALPMLNAAFTGFLVRIEPDLPLWAQLELTQIIKTACEPDFRRRGDPAARRRTGSPVGIDAYVSRFDRLTKRAVVESRR